MRNSNSAAHTDALKGWALEGPWQESCCSQGIPCPASWLPPAALNPAKSREPAAPAANDPVPRLSRTAAQLPFLLELLKPAPVCCLKSNCTSLSLIAYILPKTSSAPQEWGCWYFFSLLSPKDFDAPGPFFLEHHLDHRALYRSFWLCRFKVFPLSLFLW